MDSPVRDSASAEMSAAARQRLRKFLLMVVSSEPLCPPAA